MESLNVRKFFAVLSRNCVISEFSCHRYIVLYIHHNHYHHHWPSGPSMGTVFQEDSASLLQSLSPSALATLPILLPSHNSSPSFRSIRTV